MTTIVTGLTAPRMLEIEAASVIDGDVVGGNLILTKHDGTQINAGPVIGPAGPQGPAGVAVAPIPGEIKMWPSIILPDLTSYGKWVWANGDPYDTVTYPEASANIDDDWNTAMGQANPGAGKFRVPDLRGLAVAAPDAMPVGAARANRMTRAVALLIANRTGVEEHILTIPQLPVHTHVQNQHRHSVSHDHALQMGPTTGSGAYAARGGGTVADVGGGGAGAPIKISTNNTDYQTPTNQNAGSGNSHENVQPTIFVPYIVKLDD